MKRVGRSKSGREVYGPKWQNNETDTSEVEDDDGALVPSAQVFETKMLPAKIESTVVDDQNKIFKGIDIKGTRVSDRHQSMYRAVLEGDCVAAETLLEEDPNLARDEINEEGDRALHVAASMKHRHMLRKLVDKMSPSDLTLLDGHGYTACCYAAISGAIDIAEILIRKNPTLATIRDRENKTPLLKAALRGKTNMTSYFLRNPETKSLSIEEWFDLLLVMIRHGMYDGSLTLSRRIEQLRTMTNDEGTALHVLAQQPINENSIQRLGQVRVVELMRNPHILDDAAKAGNVELIVMITHAYPELVWQTNSLDHTIFHTAVKHRDESLFRLTDEIGSRIDLIAMSKDKNGNNIMHLAAELAPLDKMNQYMPIFQMQKEMMWFEHVKGIVPSLCLMMKNNDGYTPKELFSQKHKKLLDKSITWMRNTADSCLLISTLMFTLAFGSAFAVPGGFKDSGIPILLKNTWFTFFVTFEVLAIFSSALCMFTFWRIMVSSFEEDQFLKHQPNRFARGLSWLFISVFCAVSVFVSTYFLIYVDRRAVPVTCAIFSFYVVLLLQISRRLYLFNRNLPRRLFHKRDRHTLFKQHDVTATENNKHRLSGLCAWASSFISKK